MSSGLTLDRVFFYLDKLKRIANFLKKDLTEATIEDIKEFVRQIELNGSYSEWTKNGYKITLKKFYRRVEGSGEE